MKTNAYETGWMQTYSGQAFMPMEPKIEDINIVDIAASLSRQCRYGGHCLRFYSVAEHCILAAELAEPKLQLTTLLHDASEAYLVDIPRPLKGFLNGYYAAEEKLQAMIAEKYGTIYPLPAEVKEIDEAMLSDERQQNMASMDVGPEHWGNTTPGKGALLRFWRPELAQTLFLEAFFQYGGARE